MNQQEQIAMLREAVEGLLEDLNSPAETRRTKFAEEALAVTAQPASEAVPVAWILLSDSHLVNIVNHDKAYENYEKFEAVNIAVRLTEEKLKS